MKLVSKFVRDELKQDEINYNHTNDMFYDYGNLGDWDYFLFLNKYETLSDLALYNFDKINNPDLFIKNKTQIVPTNLYLFSVQNWFNSIGNSFLNIHKYKPQKSKNAKEGEEKIVVENIVLILRQLFLFSNHYSFAYKKDLEQSDLVDVFDHLKTFFIGDNEDIKLVRIIRQWEDGIKSYQNVFSQKCDEFKEVVSNLKNIVMKMFDVLSKIYQTKDTWKIKEITNYNEFFKTLQEDVGYDDLDVYNLQSIQKDKEEINEMFIKILNDPDAILKSFIKDNTNTYTNYLMYLCDVLEKVWLIFKKYMVVFKFFYTILKNTKILKEHTWNVYENYANNVQKQFDTIFNSNFTYTSNLQTLIKAYNALNKVHLRSYENGVDVITSLKNTYKDALSISSLIDFNGKDIPSFLNKENRYDENKLLNLFGYKDGDVSIQQYKYDELYEQEKFNLTKREGFCVESLHYFLINNIQFHKLKQRIDKDYSYVVASYWNVPSFLKNTLFKQNNNDCDILDNQIPNQSLNYLNLDDNNALSFLNQDQQKYLSQLDIKTRNIYFQTTKDIFKYAQDNRFYDYTIALQYQKFYETVTKDNFDLNAPCYILRTESYVDDYLVEDNAYYEVSSCYNVNEENKAFLKLLCDEQVIKFLNYKKSNLDNKYNDSKIKNNEEQINNNNFKLRR